MDMEVLLASIHESTIDSIYFSLRGLINLLSPRDLRKSLVFDLLAEPF